MEHFLDKEIIHIMNRFTGITDIEGRIWNILLLWNDDPEKYFLCVR